MPGVTAPDAFYPKQRMLGRLIFFLEAYLKHPHIVKASRKGKILILISYDLNRPGQDYQKLIEVIQSLGDWCHCLDSTWLVKTNFTVEMVTNRLIKQIDSNDSLLVTPVHPYQIGARLPQNVLNWIQS